MGAARVEPEARGMGVGQAVILGLVEGVTEYLPVSSTGHLILAQRAMGIGGANGEKTAADAYAIVIQAGAILAVLGVYSSHMRRIVLGVAGRDREGRQLGLNLLVGFAPAAVMGLTLADAIKQHLFSLQAVVAAWFVGGVIILAVARFQIGHRDRGGADLLTLTWRSALVIGLAQCIAVWPGMSRSLVTIVAGVLVGLELRSAVIFSFLLGALTLGASTVYDGLLHGELMLETYGATSIATGFIVALVSAVIAVKWMVTYLKHHGLTLFGYYRIALAVGVGILLYLGVIDGT